MRQRLQMFILNLSILLTATPVLGSEPIPDTLELVPGMSLGQSTRSLIANFSTKELESTDRGVRVFQVNSNSLPENTQSVRCEFQDNRLTYIEVAFTSQTSWSQWIAGPIGSFGVPSAWKDLVGADVTFSGWVEESAAWSDKERVLMYGRNGSDRVVVLASTAWLPTLKGLLQRHAEGLRAVENEAAASVRREKAAEETQEKEQKEALEAAAMEASQREEYAILQAQRAEAEAAVSQARADLPQLVSAQPTGHCLCLPGRKIEVGCTVVNNSILPAVVQVQAGGTTGSWGYKSRGAYNVTVAPQSSEEAKLPTPFSAFLNCKTAGGCWCRTIGAEVNQ